MRRSDPIIDHKGQIILPQWVMNKLGIKEGDRIIFKVDPKLGSVVCKAQ